MGTAGRAACHIARRTGRGRCHDSSRSQQSSDQSEYPDDAHDVFSWLAAPRISGRGAFAIGELGLTSLADGFIYATDHGWYREVSHTPGVAAALKFFSASRAVRPSQRPACKIAARFGVHRHRTTAGIRSAAPRKRAGVVRRSGPILDSCATALGGV
jgi:hypothetical protein